MKKIIKISTKICGALLAVLGFSAAAMSIAPQYGVIPSSYYDRKYIWGKVTDKVTGEPIKGIKVTNFNNEELFGFTNENGDYEIYIQTVFPALLFSDVDSTENGLYNDTTVSVDDNYINVSLIPKN